MNYLREFSRFSTTPTTIFDGRETYGPWVSYDFLKTRPKDDDIRVYTVTSAMEGRPDLIANAVYGTPALFWVLIAFNKAMGAINWPRSGDVIEYPSESIVIPELTQ